MFAQTARSYIVGDDTLVVTGNVPHAVAQHEGKDGDQYRRHNTENQKTFFMFVHNEIDFKRV